MRYALIDLNGIITNIIEWEGAEFLPPRDHHMLPCDTANCGDLYDFNTKEFTLVYSEKI